MPFIYNPITNQLDISSSSGGGGGGITTIDVDNSGSVTGTTIGLFANSGSANAGASVFFNAASSTEIDLVLSDSNFNTYLGSGAGVIGGGGYTVAVGYQAVQASSATQSVMIGAYAGQLTTGGSSCVGIGYSVLQNSGDSSSVAIGNFVLANNIGESNISIGTDSLGVITAGYSNIAIGVESGYNYTTNESNNILIGSKGVIGDQASIQIGDVQGNFGSPQSSCFIAGIYGNTLVSPDIVTIDPTTGQLGSQAFPSGTVTSVSVASANGLAGTVATATTTPAITLRTTVTGVLSGNGTAISGSSITQFDVLVGGATNAISSVGPGSAGQVLQSAGNAANPAYSTATYPAVATGTGKILRADGTNWSATTATYPNTAGTSGNVLTSDGTNWNSTAPAGNVAGPGSSTDRAIATWNGTAGTALFNNSTTKIDSTGRQTNSAQPCFFAYNSGTISNVTGDGTNYTLILDTTRVNNGTNYSTSTGEFTAPVAGNYFFSLTFTASTATTWVIGGSVSNTAFYNAVQSIVYSISYLSEATGSLTNSGSVSMNTVVPLAANDTVQCIFTAYTTASAKNVSLTAGQAFFCGYLVS